MLLSFLVYQLCAAIDDDSGLPFEADDDSSLPFEPDTPAEDSPAPSPDPESELENTEAELTASPTPTPAPVRRSPLEILSYREVTAAVIGIVYVVVYVIGRGSVKAKLSALSGSLLPSLRRHFAVVPAAFGEKSIHTHTVWVSGRHGHQGAVVTANFRPGSDPIGVLYSVLFGRPDRIVFEFVLRPPNVPSGMIHVAKEKPSFADNLSLKAHALGGKYSVWTDLGEVREEFVRPIKAFIEERPGMIELIEICDTNRFETRTECRFVARFEFRVVGPMAEWGGDEIVDFCVGLADAFSVLRLPGDVQQKNERLREKLTKEKEGKKEEEKKPTPEEDEKAQRRRERREQNRLVPKFKVVRQ
jgi:hypothetical protein